MLQVTYQKSVIFVIEGWGKLGSLNIFNNAETFNNTLYKPRKTNMIF